MTRLRYTGVNAPNLTNAVNAVGRTNENIANAFSNLQNVFEKRNKAKIEQENKNLLIDALQGNVPDLSTFKDNPNISTNTLNKLNSIKQNQLLRQNEIANLQLQAEAQGTPLTAEELTYATPKTINSLLQAKKEKERNIALNLTQPFNRNPESINNLQEINLPNVNFEENNENIFENTLFNENDFNEVSPVNLYESGVSLNKGSDSILNEVGLRLDQLTNQNFDPDLKQKTRQDIQKQGKSDYITNWVTEQYDAGIPLEEINKNAVLNFDNSKALLFGSNPEELVKEATDRVKVFENQRDIKAKIQTNNFFKNNPEAKSQANALNEDIVNLLNKTGDVPELNYSNQFKNFKSNFKGKTASSETEAIQSLKNKYKEVKSLPDLDDGWLTKGLNTQINRLEKIDKNLSLTDKAFILEQTFSEEIDNNKFLQSAWGNDIEQDVLVDLVNKHKRNTRTYKNQINRLQEAAKNLNNTQNKFNKIGLNQNKLNDLTKEADNERKIINDLLKSFNREKNKRNKAKKENNTRNELPKNGINNTSVNGRPENNNIFQRRSLLGSLLSNK